MSSSYPSYPQFKQSNYHNISFQQLIPNNNPNSMTVSGSLRTPGKPLHNYMCYGKNDCPPYR